MEEQGAEGGNWDGLSPEVLQMIFCHLNVNDLLSCSVVSKTWKKAARNVLKRSRECYAHIKDFDRDIQDLNQMIASTNIMEMINSLHIRNKMAPSYGTSSLHKRKISYRAHFESKCYLEEATRNLKVSKKKIQQVLGGRWKYLNLDLERLVMEIFPLGDTLLFKEVVAASSDSLEKLVMGHADDFRYIPCGNIQFPKLKVIHLHSQGLNLCSEEILSKFAPTLEKLTGAMIELCINDQGNGFLLNRMKSIRLSPHWQVPESESKKRFLSVSGLQRLDLQHYHFNRRDSLHDQDLKEWNDFVFSIVRRNLNTLVELRMYTLELYKLLSTWDDLRFPNVRKLSLATHQNVSIENEILALKQMTLAKLCPNLEDLELSKAKCTHGFEQVVNPVEVSDALDQSDTPVRIKLNCRERPYSYEYLEFLDTVYPNMNTLKIMGLNAVNACKLSRIFWDLNELEYLELCVSLTLSSLDNIDAFLCGMNIEEYRLLVRGSEMMNAVIVPIRPSLFNAKNLKELIITEKVDFGNVRRRDWVIEITENLPARHLRNLKFSFEGSDVSLRGLNFLRAFTALGAKRIMP